jgi:Cytochrome b5-like Heme/Steroid binding domain
MTIMGKAAYTVVVAFTASILTLLAVNWLAPEEDRVSNGATSVPTAPTPIASGTPSGNATNPTITPPASGGITLQQVSTHNTAASCWIVIDGIVYDITSYIPRHPTDPSVLLAWCGKESTQAWEDKGGSGRPHSSRAEASLDLYEIGRLAQ